MIFTVRYERYRNEYTRQFGNLYFAELSQIRSYLFDGMVIDPAQHMTFPARRAHEEGHGWVEPITFRREEGGDEMRLHLILQGDTCIFTDGFHTGGKRFCAKGMEAFLEDCRKRQAEACKFGELED